MSKKVHDASKGYNLFKVQFVDISNQDLPAYKFMFFNSDLTEMIDYEKSNFKLMKKTPLKEKVLDFNIAPTRDSILEVYKNECVSSIFKELIPLNGYVFKPNFQLEELDAFRIGHFDKRFYISERLKENYVKMGITGCEYIEQELFNTPRNI